MYTLKWSVLQYAAVRPRKRVFSMTEFIPEPDVRLVISIAGIVCEAFNVLCTQTYSVHYAEVYLTAVDFVSIRRVRPFPLGAGLQGSPHILLASPCTAWYAPYRSFSDSSALTYI